MTQPVGAARRYARAAFEVARQKRAIQGWRTDLETLVDTFTDPRVRQMFANPRLDDRRRIGIALGLLPDDFNLDRANLVKLLVLARRTEAIVAIRDEFEGLLSEAEGRTELEVVVAHDVSDEFRQRLAGLLGEKLGRQVEVAVRVDPAILGGAVVRHGDRVTDGSVRRRLTEMREELLAS